jgi:hypothetical protein
MPLSITGFVGRQNYLAQPLGGDTFLLSVSGVASLDLPGQPGTDWRSDTVDMYVPLANALAATKRTPRPGNILGFKLQQWTTLVTPNNFTDLNQAVNFGVRVQEFDIDWRNGAPNPGIHVTLNVAARDIDAHLLGLGYLLILIGNVVEMPNPVP